MAQRHIIADEHRALGTTSAGNRLNKAGRDELESLGFEALHEFNLHLTDINARLRAEQQQASPNEGIIRGLVEEKTATLNVLSTYSHQKPTAEREVEEVRTAPFAVQLTRRGQDL